MRTTLTLDEDVAAKLEREAKRSGKSFKAVVNETLRRGLLARKEGTSPKPFVVRSRNLGLREGLSYANIEELLDIVEGPARR